MFILIRRSLYKFLTKNLMCTEFKSYGQQLVNTKKKKKKTGNFDVWCFPLICFWLVAYLKVLEMELEFSLPT